jgi:DNA-3-methyladenine glycosylase
MTGSGRLDGSFFEADARVVARGLLGMHLRHGDVVLRITEVEAYCWPDDTANHCRMGRTLRNEPMWGPPGRAYVYLCYGLHQMLNLVTNPEGEGAAVLIRSCEPVEGLDIIGARRGGRDGPTSLNGPGKVGAALGVDRSFCNQSVVEQGGLEVGFGLPPTSIVSGPRIGISYASPEHQAAPWRYADGESLYVSYRRMLAPC